MQQGAAMSRRRFVQGVAWAGVAAAFETAGAATLAGNTQSGPPILSGTHFELTIDELRANFTGRSVMATGINGCSPGPTLRWREGDNVTITVTNRLKMPSSLHWHGVRLPAGMDGVPGLSFRGIEPGETFVYRIPVRQSGTYWYHSHSHFEEQTGLIGALIVDRKDRDPIAFDREYVIFLSDWSDANPDTIFSNLKQESDYYNYHRGTLANFISEAKQKGVGATLSQRMAWARMDMSPSDIADVSGAAYTYLLNGQPPDGNWTGLFHPGERVRLRFINGSSMTFFDVRIPGLRMTVVQSDGNDVEPVAVDEMRIGAGETYDAIAEPEGDRAYTIFAQAEDRSGFARGTLAATPGMTAEVPPMDPRPQRTMADMGMNMSGMGGMKGMSGMEVRKDIAQPEPSAMPAGAEKVGGAFMRPLPQPGPGVIPVVSASMAGEEIKAVDPVRLHAGPEVVEAAAMTMSRLSDPGDGLGGNGRRVLTYADLRARYRGVDGRPPTREIELHLTGNMERFIWGFDGRKFSEAEPIHMQLGERLRVVLVNDTMMEHPIHLHGLWSEVENGHGAFNPYKHTVVVKPAERVSYLISADTPGRWAFHCHLLYHMHAGMFRTVVVS